MTEPPLTSQSVTPLIRPNSVVMKAGIRFDRVRLGAPVGTEAPKRRADGDYSAATAGDSNPAMADFL
jgi:hypothetical protein